MFDSTQLIGFVAAVALLVLVPGPNTAIILAHSLGRGRGAGMATVAGVEVGTLAHTIAAALGLSALLSASPVGFAALKLAGVIYLMVIGVRSLLHRTSRLAPGNSEVLGGWVAFRRALLTNLLNPKVALFFLAFLPQFVRPERGHAFEQFMVLGLIVSLMGIGVGSTLVFLASALAGWLRENTSFERWQQRITGGVFIGLAVCLAMTQ